MLKNGVGVGTIYKKVEKYILVNCNHRSQITPNELICLNPPCSRPSPFPRGSSGPEDAGGRELLCILHKAQVWAAWALASTIFKSFKSEDLSILGQLPFLFYFVFFFPGEKKINYAIVITPGCIRKRGISVLKCPGVNWGYFPAFGFLFGGVCP